MSTGTERTVLLYQMQDEKRGPHCEQKIELECRETKGSLCTINGPSIADNFLCSLEV